MTADLKAELGGYGTVGNQVHERARWDEMGAGTGRGGCVPI